MNEISKIGLGECLSCGAMALDVAVYQVSYEGIEKQCCRMCAYKTPWLYEDSLRTIMETMLYIGNVIRMDISNK